MAEIKNSFLRSKMNKDLDDRLIPNGEYRDAQNISVGKSEDDDIGALENILGNTVLDGSGNWYGTNNLKIIGYCSDDNNSIIYYFLTDYTDGDPNNPTPASSTSKCFIYKFSNNTYTKLVEGNFLNFSTTNLISGINLVENLLFWTDNRNQPRKINVNKTLGYYDSENQISVAKYNPYEPLEVIKKTEVTGATSTGTALTLAQANTSILKGMLVVSKLGANNQAGISADEYVYVTNIVGTAITLNVAPSVAVLAADTVIFVETTMTGEDISPFFNNVLMPGNPNWPGDPDYLESRFVRFSYRFKFDDGEYSLMAPFSQPTFIPKQKGYFLGSGGASPTTPKDEDEAYRSTVVEFMENGVQNVELSVPLPDIINNLGENTNDTYKITHVDILYKESDQRVVKVIESVNIGSQTGTTNYYNYNYRSSKPYKTLNERQTIRVYDKVPVRALSQEISGNRVMYGNYQSQHTPPQTIDYQVGANEKSAPTIGEAVTEFYNWVEYPNHTLKQNRNYQVGFILSDKFGRQSSVILSSNDTFSSSGAVNFGGSTIYHPYNTSAIDLKKWFGDALKVLINSEITSLKNQSEGIPGLYAVPEGNGFNITGIPAITDTTYSFILAGGAATTGLPVVNSYLRGENTDFVKVTNITTTTTSSNTPSITQSPGTVLQISLPNVNIVPGMVVTAVPIAGWSVQAGTTVVSVNGANITLNQIITTSGIDTPANYVITFTGGYVVTTEGRVNDFLYSVNPLNTPDTKFAYTLPNTLGWYSYKIVVKQQEQDYYNAYLPGILSGYPDQQGTSSPPFPSDPLGATANIVLINDNINKIPRDLSEVGPQQKQFRSSVQLSGRVQNNSASTNIQYFPGIKTDTAVNISTADDSNMKFDTLSTAGQANLYQLDTNPLIARLSTNPSNNIGVVTATMRPYLAIYETEPLESALQLFYESSSAGLIADLNADVATGFDGVASLTSLTLNLTEASDPAVSNGDISNEFYPQNNQGVNFANTDITSVNMTVIDGVGTTATSNFSIVTSNTGYKFRVANNNFVYDSNGAIQGIYTVTLAWETTAGDQSETTTIITLGNITPKFAVGASLPDESVNPSNTAVVTRNGFNGSASNSAAALYYSIVGGNTGNYFTMNPTSGAITQVANTTPLGVYNLTLRIDDAAIGNNLQTGTLFKELPQKITVGPTDVNTGVISNCKNIGSPNNSATNQMTAIRDQGVFTGVWYLSNSTLTNSDLPVTPSASYSSGSNTSDYLFKLGSALTRGTVVFACNMQQYYSNNGGGFFSFSDSGLTWKIWYRDPSGTNTWNQIDDVNNNNMDAPGVPVVLTSDSLNNNKWAQAAFAFNQVGEYCVAAINASTNTAQVDADAMCAWVNSSDLYYSNCVVENGQVVTDNNSPKRYKYLLSTAQSSYNCVTVGTTKYAPMPYGTYVDLFYNDVSLTTPFTPSSNEYYAFTTDPTEPFDSIKTSAKFNTSGTKISPALGLADTCDDMYARACQGGNITCAHPIPGGNNW